MDIEEAVKQGLVEKIICPICDNLVGFKDLVSLREVKEVSIVKGGKEIARWKLDELPSTLYESCGWCGYPILIK